MIHRLLLSLFSAGLLAQSPAAPAPKVPLPPVVGPDTKVVTPVEPKLPTAPRVPLAPATAPTRGATTGPAQVPGSASSIPQLPADLLVFDVTTDGHELAAANGWKAEFAPGGFSFVPFLGSDSTEPCAVRVAPASATVGGVGLELRAADPVRTDRCITQNRGSCIERFDATPGGVEQSFVFASLPNRGELVIDLAVSTAMRREPGDRGVHFVGQRGGVAVTDAVAIDANGRRCELPIEPTEGGLRLAVPAAFVAEAALPLVVDPAYAPLLFWTSNVVDSNPDIAFLPSLGEYMVVWQHDFSATDRDVWALRFTSGMQGNANFFTFDISSVSWELPRIASCELAQNYMLVAQASLGSVSPFWVVARTWSQQTGTLGTAFVVEADGVPGHASGDKLSPDIGGDPSPLAPVYYTIVWERVWTSNDHDVHCKQVTPDGVLRSASPTFLDNGVTNETNPRIAKSDGPGNGLLTQQWPVVWQRTYSPTDEDVYGSALSWDGQIMVPVRALTLSADDERDPCPSSPTLQFGPVRRHLVAWSRYDPSFDQEIVVSLYDQAGALLTSDWLGYAEGNGPERSRPQVRPALDCDGSRFAVAYSEYDAIGTRWDTRLSLCAYDAGLASMIVQESRVWLGATGSDEDRAAIVAQGSVGGGPTAYGVVYDLDDLAGTWGIVAQAYDGHASLPLPTTRSTGCGALGIALGEVPALGATLHFTQTDNGPLTGFLFGFPQSLPLGICPGCTVGVNGYVVPNPFSFVVPMQPVFVGMPLSCQAWSFVGGPCLGTVAMSDTIDLQLL